MSVASGDLRVFSCLLPSWGDGVTVGGAIDTGTLMLFDAPTYANAPGLPNSNTSGIYVQSTWASDKGLGIYVLVSGRNAGGSIITECIPLSGTSISSGRLGIGGNGSSGAIDAANYYERILGISFPSGTALNAGGHSGIISIYAADATQLADLPSGVSGVRRPFLNVSSQTNSGIVYFEKVFIRNLNVINNLQSAYVSYVSNTLSNNVSFALDSGLNTSWTIPNRQYWIMQSGLQTGNPAGGSGVSGTSIAMGNNGFPAGDIPAGTGSVPVWLALSLAQNGAAAKGLYTLSISGFTT